MKKALKLFAVMCLCAIAACVALGCGSSAPSSSSASAKSDSSFSSDPATKTVSTDPVYILVDGNDSRYGTSEQTDQTPETKGYADTIMLMRVDPAKNHIAIVSIPRDTAAEFDGKPDKINAVHWAGPEALAKEVGNMFGVDVPYYFDYKFIEFANFVDKLGGVKVDVPMSLTGGDIINDDRLSVEAGPNTLDGVTALMLCRQRKVYADNGEAIRQMITRDLVANAIQAAAAQPSTEAAKYANLLETSGNTNMPADVLEAYIAAFQDSGQPISFSLGTTPYAGSLDESTGVWCIPRDGDVYAQLKQAMEDGGNLADVVPLPAVY